MMNRAGRWCEGCAQARAQKMRATRDRLGLAQVCLPWRLWDTHTEHMVRDCFRRSANAAVPSCDCEPGGGP